MMFFSFSDSALRLFTITPAKYLVPPMVYGVTSKIRCPFWLACASRPAADEFTYQYHGVPDGLAYMTTLNVPVSLLRSRSTSRAWLVVASALTCAVDLPKYRHHPLASVPVFEPNTAV